MTVPGRIAGGVGEEDLGLPSRYGHDRLFKIVLVRHGLGRPEAQPVLAGRQVHCAARPPVRGAGPSRQLAEVEQACPCPVVQAQPRGRVSAGETGKAGLAPRSPGEHEHLAVFPEGGVDIAAKFAGRVIIRFTVPGAGQRSRRRVGHTRRADRHYIFAWLDYLVLLADGEPSLVPELVQAGHNPGVQRADSLAADLEGVVDHGDLGSRVRGDG